MGVYRALPARAAWGEQSSAAQETSYLGACDLDQRRNRSSRTVAGLCTPPQGKAGCEPTGLGEAPGPQHLLCWRAREVGQGEGQEEAMAVHGYSGPPQSSEKAWEGAPPPPVCLQRPSTKGT